MYCIQYTEGALPSREEVAMATRILVINDTQAILRTFPQHSGRRGLRSYVIRCPLSE